MSLRVCKAIARATGISRRTAEKLIVDKQVVLNGSLLINPATHVDINPKTLMDDLWVKGAKVDLSKAQLDTGAPKGKTRLWILHKLRQELVTDHDPDGRPTVYQRIASMMGEDHFNSLGMKAVGRLDFMSEGLLLLTNDGVLKRYLEMPKTGLERNYKVQARGRLNIKWLDYLGRGAYINNKKYKSIGVDVLKSKGTLNKTHEMNVTLTEGKTREIRNALTAGGMSVNKLMRIGYGPYSLGTLEKGSLREIKPHRSHLRRMMKQSYHTSSRSQGESESRSGSWDIGDNVSGEGLGNEISHVMSSSSSSSFFVSEPTKVKDTLRSLKITRLDDLASIVPGVVLDEEARFVGKLNDPEQTPRQELLCLDVGTKRTGISISNIEYGLATPIDILIHPDPNQISAEEVIVSFRKHVSILNQLIETNNITAIVVGWPLEINGAVGPQCEIVKEYCVMLHQQAKEMVELNERKERKERKEVKEVKEVKEKTRQLSDLCTVVWDERWSTEAVLYAQKYTHEDDMKPRRKFKRSQVGKAFEDHSKNDAIDDLAATYILQGVLEWLRKDEYQRDLEMDGLDGFRPPKESRSGFYVLKGVQETK